MTCAIPVQCSTDWTIKLSGSWSLCKFVIYPLDGEGYKQLHVHDAEQFPTSLYNFYIWFINREQSQLCILGRSTHSRDRWNFRSCKQLNVYCHECMWLQKTWSLMQHEFDHVNWLQFSNLRRMSVNSIVTFQPSFFGLWVRTIYLQLFIFQKHLFLEVRLRKLLHQRWKYSK